MVSNNLKKKFQELSELTYKAVTVGQCIRCGTCIKFCPLDLRIFGKEGNAITIKSQRSCGGCSVCYHRCPQKAIRLVTIEKKK